MTAGKHMVLTFANDSDQALRKALLKASARFYGANTDKDAILLLSAQATLMFDVLWSAVQRIIPDADPKAFHSLTAQSAEIVTSSQHIVQDGGSPPDRTVRGQDQDRRGGT